MTRPIRPAVAFVLRLWREPSDQEGDAGWRGQIRPLGAGKTETYFHGLDDLPVTLRQMLNQKDVLIIPASDQAGQNVKQENEK